MRQHVVYGKTVTKRNMLNGGGGDVKQLFAKRLVAPLVALTMIAGCASTPEQFYANRAQLSDANLCRTYNDSDTLANPDFFVDVNREVRRRGLNGNSCEDIIRNQNTLIGVGVILGAAVIAASRGAGGGYAASNQYDAEWDWDQFYNEYRQLVWVCRGVQTGEFADASRCSGKWQTDSRWPQK